MVWDNGLAGPCMASVHGWCMGAWQLGCLVDGVTSYGGCAATGGSLK